MLKTKSSKHAEKDFTKNKTKNITENITKINTGRINPYL